MTIGSRLAKALSIVALVLACSGPFGLVYIGCQAPANSHREERKRWAVAEIIFLASPAGALLGASIHFWYRRRHRFRYADASVPVGIASSLAILVMFPMFAQSRDSRPSICYSNEKQLVLGLLQYAQDYDDRLPLHNSWNDALFPYTKNASTLMCPEEEYQKVPSYGFNGVLAGRTITPIKDSSNVVTLIDSTTGRNREVSLRDFPFPDRHGTHVNVAFADGHVKVVQANRVRDLIWNPEWPKKKAGKK